LCYSVLEVYDQLFNVHISSLLDTSAAATLLDGVFTTSDHREALAVVIFRLDTRPLRKRLELGSLRLSDVIAAFRHTFVHGDLSPGATDGDNRSLSTVVVRLAKSACPFMLDQLDDDLTTRVTCALGASD